jgi:cytochrome P450
VAEELLRVRPINLEALFTATKVWYPALTEADKGKLTKSKTTEPFLETLRTTQSRLDAVVKEVMRLTPPVGGFFRRSRQPLALAGVLVPADRVVQVSISASHRHGLADNDLELFRPQRHLTGEPALTLLPFGGGERVCLGKSLAELEVRLLTVGLLKSLTLELEPDQDLTLATIPSPSPKQGLLVRPQANANFAAAVQ